MEVTYSAEYFVDFKRTTRLYIPEDRTLLQDVQLPSVMQTRGKAERPVHITRYARE
jgi:hypothetical protein